MIIDLLGLSWMFGIFIIMLFIIGIYSILVTNNLLRVLIGLEVLIKGVTLLLVVAGYISGHTALAQAMVITLIVIEAVIVTVAMGVVLGIFRHNNSLDVRNIRRLKG